MNANAYLDTLWYSFIMNTILFTYVVDYLDNKENWFS